MKKLQAFNSDLLTLDVCDYLFVEWLIRHNLYRKFVKNLSLNFEYLGVGRSLIRRYIRRFIGSRPCLENIIAMAFPFDETSEGYGFWQRASNEWFDFCNDFFRK